MLTYQSTRIVGLCILCLLCCSRVAAKKNSKLDTCRLNYKDSSDSVPDILYYRSTPLDSDESMQYAWSTVGAPTLFFSHGPVPSYCNSSLLSVDLDAFRENQTYHSVNISGADGAFAAAVVLHRLIEFNVSNKFEGAEGFNPSLAFNDSSNYTSYYLDQPNMWSFSNESQTFHLEDNSTETKFSDGPFKFSIRATFPTKADEQRLPYFPKSLYTENSTTFDLILENYPYNMTTSRVALEMLLVHNHNTPSGNVTMSTTVDDEYTPSVFDTFQYRFGKDPGSNETTGFFQWKPISYQTGSRKSTSSQQANIAYASNDTQEEHASIPSGLASAVFEDSTVSNVTLVYIVFGTSGDDTWNHSSYLTWTAVVGYGEVPHDRLSMLVVITIILGLGIPVVVVLAGGGYVMYRRRPWQNIVRWVKSRGRNSYSALN